MIEENMKEIERLFIAGPLDGERHYVAATTTTIYYPCQLDAPVDFCNPEENVKLQDYTYQLMTSKIDGEVAFVCMNPRRRKS